MEFATPENRNLGIDDLRFAVINVSFQLQILVNRKDGGNLMNDNNTDEMLKMERFIVKNVTITDGIKILTYPNICGVYCNESNDVVLTFIKVYYFFYSIRSTVSGQKRSDLS